MGNASLTVLLVSAAKSTGGNNPTVIREPDKSRHAGLGNQLLGRDHPSWIGQFHCSTSAESQQQQIEWHIVRELGTVAKFTNAPVTKQFIHWDVTSFMGSATIGDEDGSLTQQFVWPSSQRMARGNAIDFVANEHTVQSNLPWFYWGQCGVFVQRWRGQLPCAQPMVQSARHQTVEPATRQRQQSVELAGCDDQYWAATSTKYDCVVYAFAIDSQSKEKYAFRNTDLFTSTAFSDSFSDSRCLDQNHQFIAVVLSEAYLLNLQH